MDQEIAFLASLGGDAAIAQYDAFAGCLVGLLARAPEEVSDRDAYLGAIRHGFSLYYWRWDARASDLYGPVCAALERWAEIRPVPVDLVSELADFVYFLVWCFDGSSTEQSRRLVPPLGTASRAFAATADRQPAPLPVLGPYRIAWLAMYAQERDAMSCALRDMAAALRHGGHTLTVYAWKFHDAAFADRMAALGVTVTAIAADRHEAIVQAIEEQVARDRPQIVVSDMNNAVPTALFARRLAPVQILLQAGMPAWPVAHLDAVFNSFGFDPETAGWGDALSLSTAGAPWDLAALDPPIAAEAVAAERASIPLVGRLIGTYCRLSKVTPEYLAAVELILLRCPDVSFVIGGSGDPGRIAAFVVASSVGNRMHVAAGWVQGHVWGHMLDVMLDTWPVTGGEACREIMAKSRPVVTRHSDEMPALDLQRDEKLVCHDWAAYVEETCRLLKDPEVYAAACARSRAVAERHRDGSAFADTVNAGIDRTVRRVRRRRSWPGRLAARLGFAVR